MATVKFSLSSKTGNGAGNEILVRFYQGKINQRAKTNIFVKAELWNEATGRAVLPPAIAKARLLTADVIEARELVGSVNAKLEALCSHIEKSFIEAGAGKMELPKEWLRSLLQHYNFPDAVLANNSYFEVFRHFIDTKRISEQRKRDYLVLYRAFRRYCIVRKFEPTFANVTTDTLSDFIQFLKDEHKSVKMETDPETGKQKAVYKNGYGRAMAAAPESRPPAPRGNNTITDRMKCFRTWYKWLIRQGYATTDPFATFEMPKESYGRPYYLTKAERDQLYNCDLSGRPGLATQRDVFIFQCNVGCRVSDLERFTKQSVINGAIEYIPRKTRNGKPVTVRVPLNSIAREILDKYADIPGEKLLPFISDQNYNKAIKEMVKAAGLNRLVTIQNPTTGDQEQRPLYEVASSHLARRTFAGILYKKLKDPNLIGALTGHAEGSRAFSRYRDIDEKILSGTVKKLE